MRQTRTNIEYVSEHTPNDNWSAESDVLLSEEWTGTARFQFSRVTLPEGCRWVTVTNTKVQNTSSRPDTIWPKEWPRLSKKHRLEKIEAWNEEGTGLQDAHVPSQDTEYLKVVSEARTTMQKCECRSMPCIPKGKCRRNPTLCRYSDAG